MKDLSQMPNIEKGLEEKLIIIGITSPDDLSWVGSKEAFYRMSLIFPQDTCLNLLYSLEGAIRGKQWGLLKKEVRKDLVSFYRLLN